MLNYPPKYSSYCCIYLSIYFFFLLLSQSDLQNYTCLTHSWSWALLEKLPIVQLLKNFPAFYGTRRFITVFTRALHWSLSSARTTFDYPFKIYKRQTCLICKNMCLKFHCEPHKNPYFCHNFMNWNGGWKFLKLKLQGTVQFIHCKSFRNCWNEWLLTPLWCTLYTVADQFGLTKRGGSDSNSGQRRSKTSVILFRSASGNAQANAFTSQLPHYSSLMNPEEMEIL
jgi:hypothetical protein